MKVLLDANFLVIPFENRFDAFKATEELLEERFFELPEYLILSCTLNELKKTKKINQGLINEVIERNKIRVIDCFGKSDEKILEYAKKEEKIIVATNDVLLRRRLRLVGVKTISLKGKNHLEIQYPFSKRVKNI